MLFNLFKESDEDTEKYEDKSNTTKSANGKKVTHEMKTYKSEIIEKTTLKSVIINIPLSILIYFNNNMICLYMKANCNNTIEDISKFLKEKYSLFYVSLYHRSALLVATDLIHQKLYPNSIIIGCPLSRYKIFKRLGNGESTWTTSATKFDAILFEPVKSVLICGFSTYSPTNSSSSYRITFQFKLNGTVVYNATEPIIYDGSNKIVKYELNPSKYFEAKANSKVTIVQSINGATTFKGNKFSGAQEEVFKVKSASECNNGTGTSDGQIAELFYIPL